MNDGRFNLDGILYDIDGSFMPMGSNHGNVSGVLADLRNTYMEAEREALNGNMDKMSDFLINAMKTVKQRLQEVRDLSTVPYFLINTSIPVLIINTAVKFNERIEILSKKSIRDKLLT